MTRGAVRPWAAIVCRMPGRPKMWSPVVMGQQNGVHAENTDPGPARGSLGALAAVQQQVGAAHRDAGSRQGALRQGLCAARCQAE